MIRPMDGAHDPPHAGADELTIDELARRTGTTVRNIRAHQSRGLLPAPVVRARTGYYGAEHVARLELIREMQADGFNLKAIKRLLEGAEGSSAEVLGLAREIMTPFGDETPEYVTRADLEQRFGAPFDEKLARRALKLGLVVPLAEDRYELPNPALVRAGEQVIALGVPLDHALAVVEQIMRSSKAVADAFVKLFVRDVLTPVQRDPTPERWAEVREAVERLRPLASDALLAGFQQQMTKASERAFGDVLR
jgi:DNA-binding transcriptional MerR regulator